MTTVASLVAISGIVALLFGGACSTATRGDEGSESLASEASDDEGSESLASGASDTAVGVTTDAGAESNQEVTSGSDTSSVPTSDSLGTPDNINSGSGGSDGGPAEPEAADPLRQEPDTTLGAATGDDPISVEASGEWTWEECGRIPSAPQPPSVTPIFAPDGSSVVVQDGNGRFLRYALPLDTSAPVALRPADAPAGVNIAFSPDGTLLAEAGTELVLRNLADDSVVASLELPAACGAERLAISEDNGLVLAGGSAASCVFDAGSGALLGSLPSAEAIAFRGTQLVVADCLEGSCQLIVYQADGTEMMRRDLSGPDAPTETRAVSVSPSGDSLATIGVLTDGMTVVKLAVWNSDDGSLRWTQTMDEWLVKPSYSPSGDLLLTELGVYRSSDGTLVTPASERTSQLMETEPALAPDGLLLATNRLSLHDVETGGGKRLLRPHGLENGVTDLAISADGELLISNAESVIGWRVAEPFSASQAVWMGGNGGPAIYVAISPNGDFATISGDRQQMFDGRNGLTLLPGLAPPADIGFCFAFQFEFSPDSRFVAGKRYAPAVTVYDTQSLSAVASFNTESCGQGIAFSPDGALLHTPEGSFSTTDWQPVSALKALPQAADLNAFYDIDVSSDGAQLLHTACTPEDGCHSSLSAVDTDTSSSIDADLTALDVVPQWIRRHLSDEGHWVIGAGMLLHWPTGSVINYADGVSAARFAPNGDLIAGFENGDLARYCRTTPTP